MIALDKQIRSMILCRRGTLGALLLIARSPPTGSGRSVFSTSLKPLELNSSASFTLLHTLDRRSSPTAVARMSTLGGRGAGKGVVHFPLSSSSTLIIQKGDITKWSVDGSTDAIVRTIILSPSIDLVMLPIVVSTFCN